MDGWKVSWMDGPATKTAPATKWAGVEAQQAINGPIRNTQLQPPTAVAGSQSAEASRLCSKWAAKESPGQPITFLESILTLMTTLQLKTLFQSELWSEKG